MNPCRNCGSEDIGVTKCWNSSRVWGECHNCGMSGPKIRCAPGSYREAIKLWDSMQIKSEEELQREFHKISHLLDFAEKQLKEKDKKLNYWVKVFRPIDTGNCNGCDHWNGISSCVRGQDTKRGMCCYHTRAKENDIHKNMIEKIQELEEENGKLKENKMLTDAWDAIVDLIEFIGKLEDTSRAKWTKKEDMAIEKHRRLGDRIRKELDRMKREEKKGDDDGLL